MGQEDFYRAPYPVAYTAMKSGLKGFRFIEINRVNLCLNLYRDEKRTESSMPMPMGILLLPIVSTYAAMKSDQATG